MNAKYCDRCGKLFKEDYPSHSEINFDRYGELVFDGDLCSNCQDKLENFMENKK